MMHQCLSRYHTQTVNPQIHALLNKPSKRIFFVCMLCSALVLSSFTDVLLSLLYVFHLRFISNL